MAILNSAFSVLGAAQALAPQIAQPGSMWHLLILKTFAFVADYGWRIVVFTVLLKLVLSPLDFYQRYKMHKNQKITERLKPTMEKIQKQYGNDKQAFSQKQMELNRKEGYSYFSSCLPMIATLVVFITLWLSMQTIAEYMTFREYVTVYDEYTFVRSQVYEYDEDSSYIGSKDENNITSDEFDKRVKFATEVGQEVVYEMYYNGLTESFATTLRERFKDRDQSLVALLDDVKILPDGVTSIKKVQASFLWIKNIWAPDVPWGDQAVLSAAAFKKGIADYSSAGTNGLATGMQKIHNENVYGRVMAKVLNDKTQSRTNGYLLLPLLVVVLSLASQLISTRQQKRAGQVNAKGGIATSMKVMMVITPIMMAVFAVNYASIFAVYMVVNSAITLVLNFAFTAIIGLMDKRRKTRNYGISSGSVRVSSGKQSPIIHYVKGANPNAGAREPVTDNSVSLDPDAAQIGKQSKKSKKSAQSARVVARGSRPDPNDLMGMDMSNKTGKKK